MSHFELGWTKPASQAYECILSTPLEVEESDKAAQRIASKCMNKVSQFQDKFVSFFRDIRRVISAQARSLGTGLHATAPMKSPNQVKTLTFSNTAQAV